jgi:hypothetical protein
MPLAKGDWFVAPALADRARRLIAAYHYAKGCPNTFTALDGIYRKADNELMGVAWWIPPTRPAAENLFPDDWEAVLSLSRLVLHPDVPSNGATFMLSRSVRALAPRWRCLVTYADTWQGHHGGIYRAAGWQYLGLTTPARTYTKDGKMVARKAHGKTRTHAQMLATGAICEGKFARHRFRLLRHQKLRPSVLERQQSMGGILDATH